MGLFYNNNVAGPGVSKHEHKKPLARFWELFTNKFWTFFLINMVYFVFCIPVVTIGPATAALTAMMRNIYLERPQFILHDFWIFFKKNFKQSFLVGILDIAAIAGLAFSLSLYPVIPDGETALKVFFVLAVVAELLFLLMSFYIYPQIVALDLKLIQIVENSLILICTNPLGELIAAAFIAGYVVLFLTIPLIIVSLMPFVPLAWLAFISFFCCYPAVQKHLIKPYYEKTGERNPEIPEWMEEEDIALFKDSGGKDKPIKIEKKTRGKKVIK